MSPDRFTEDFDDLASPASLAWAIGGAAAGAALALYALPELAPAIVASLSAPQPKIFWHLSRASGLVSYALLGTSMLLGLLLSTRFAKTWPGAPRAFALHEHASVLGLAFALFHAVVLLGDRHTPFALSELLVPFASGYRPVALGLGQLAIWVMALVVGSSYVRKHIGPRVWRLVHFGSFAVFALATAHGVAAGTDRALLIAGAVPLAAVLFLASFRVLTRLDARLAPSRSS